MSKKRKTRKQKEQAKSKIPVYNHSEVKSTPTYIIEKAQIEVEKVIPEKKVTYSFTKEDFALNKDLVSISAASGIIIAFYALLAALLFSGVVRLNFLGY